MLGGGKLKSLPQEKAATQGKPTVDRDDLSELGEDKAVLNLVWWEGRWLVERKGHVHQQEVVMHRE